ncbi:MAG: hypothetical protein WC532_01645 [Candidatus Omnitrophota bacterium]
MKKKIRRIILLSALLVAGLLFVAKFGGPAILRMYIEAGVGDCKKIPVLCIVPQSKMSDPVIDEEYVDGLLPYVYPEVEVRLPRGFTVVKQIVKRVYYKKWKKRAKGATIYLLHEPPDYFIRLFPQLKGVAVKNDYDFVSRLMHARVSEIKNVTDAFFVVMKGIFIPDLADQNSVKIIHYSGQGRKGFIGYNMGAKENYFDCNIVGPDGYFKVYIKDMAKTLDLEKVAAILSTLKARDGSQANLKVSPPEGTL